MILLADSEDPDQMDTQAELGLFGLHMPKDTFSLDMVEQQRPLLWVKYFFFFFWQNVTAYLCTIASIYAYILRALVDLAPFF